jgi:PAS domain S-box-containing protein
MAVQPLREVFQAISAKLVDLFDVDHSTITLLDEGRRFFRVETEYPDLPSRLVGERIPIQDRATQLGLVTRQEPVVAEDLDGHALTSESPSFRQIARALDIRSLLIVPMVTNGETIGTVSLDTIGRTKCFSKKEVELCQAVSNQLAAFVAIARLAEEQQKYRRQAELITSSPTRTGVFAREAATRLFDELAKVIQFKKASLQLIVDGNRILVGAFGFDSPHPWLLRPVEADPIIRDIVHTQRPTILPDTSDAKYWEKQADTADVNSWIGMPLVFRGEPIGILTLDHDQVGFYANIPEHALACVNELAVQAAHDLWPAYNLEVAQRQVRALEIVRQFAETVATKLDPQDLLLTVVSVISKGLECTRCCIFLAEPREQSDILVCKAACHEVQCAVTAGWVLPTLPLAGKPCPVCRTFHSGESVLIYDREQDLRFDYSHEVYQGIRSMTVVPLKIASQVIGAVLAVHDRPGWFSGADQLLLETLARQAASAIERDYGLELVHSIGNKILGATEVKAVLEDVVYGAMKLTHSDSGVIYEINEDTTDLIRIFKPEGSIHPRPRLENPKGITRTVMATKTLLEIEDIRKDTRVNPELRDRYRSMFAVPLLLGQSVVGVLYLNGKSVRGLTETERSLLATLAGQAALAIQRTRLHEQIRDSASMYRSLFDNIPQRVCWKDTQSRFIWANAAFCRSLERSLEEIIGKADFDFYPEQDAKKYIRDDREVMQSKQPMVLDEKNQSHAEAPPVWVRVVKTPVLDRTHEVIGVQAIFWEITEEKQMTERWQSLVEQSPDGIVIHKDGIIMLSNPAAVRLFGVNSADELKGRSILDFIHETSRDLAAERLRKLIKKEEVAPMVEMRVQRKSGEIVDVEVSAWPGPVEHEFQVVFHDVTRTKTLLREMHHRVRRSLNQVNGFLTRQEQFATDQEGSRAFDTLRERIQAMALVHQILYRTGRESDVEMELYLAELREALLREHGSFDEIAVDFSAVGVILNEKQATACGLIVTELVSNSLLHAFPQRTPLNRKGRVSVSLLSDEGVLRLSVCDNGVGMPRTSGKAGEAMGLSLVRSLVSDDLKGTMSVATTSEAGTSFVIEFPNSAGRRIVGNGR